MRVINQLLSLTSPSTPTPSKPSSIIHSHLTGPNTHSTAILLHARYANLPLQLLHPLHSNLHEDLIWAQQQEDDPNQTEAGNFSAIQNILLLSLCSLPDQEKSIPSTSTSTSRCTSLSPSTTRAIDVTGSSSLIFDNFEDEVYFQAATAALMFKPTVSPENNLIAALFPVSVFQSCMNSLSSMLSFT